MKIAILLGDSNLETLIRAKSLAQALRSAIPLVGSAPTVTIGLPFPDEQTWKRNAYWLTNGLETVVVRRLSWQKTSSDDAVRMHESRVPKVSLAHCDHVVLPRDWGSNFMDCDAWIVMADPGLGAVYPVKPIAYFCSELASRRSPYAFCADFRSAFWDDQLAAFMVWRQAGFVVTTDRLAAADVVDFAGVAPDRVLALPKPFDLQIGQVNGALTRRPGRILIRMEPDSLHDIAATLQGLRMYRAEGGAGEHVIACQSPAEAFGKQSNIPDVVIQPAAVREMLGEITIEQMITPDCWLRLLMQADAVWSPRRSGQGSHLAWPLRLERPVLAAEHPASRELVRMNVAGISLYRPGNAIQVADALHAFSDALNKSPAPAAIDHDAAILTTQAELIVDRLLEMVDV